MWYLDPEVKKAMEDGVPHVLHNVIPQERLFDWNMVVRVIDDHDRKFHDTRDHNRYLRAGGFVVHRIEDSKHLQYWAALAHEINREYPSPDSSIHMYGSLTANSETYGVHRDTADVFYFGICGIVTWEAHNNEEGTDPFLVVDIKPGDVIFMPRGVWHNTIPRKNRVGISMGREFFRYPWEEQVIVEDNTN